MATNGALISHASCLGKVTPTVQYFVILWREFNFVHYLMAAHISVSPEARWGGGDLARLQNVVYPHFISQFTSPSIEAFQGGRKIAGTHFLPNFTQVAFPFFPYLLL